MGLWQDEESDPRWLPLHQMLKQAHKRYDRPVVMSETRHPKEDRPRWMDMIARECAKTIEADIPLLGVCWYPVSDRPD